MTFVDVCFVAAAGGALGALAYVADSVVSAAGRLQRFEGNLHAELNRATDEGYKKGTEDTYPEAHSEGWDEGYHQGILDANEAFENSRFVDASTGEPLVEIELTLLGLTDDEEDEEITAVDLDVEELLHG